MNWSSFTFIDLFAGIGGSGWVLNQSAANVFFLPNSMKMPARHTKPILENILLAILQKLIPVIFLILTFCWEAFLVRLFQLLASRKDSATKLVAHCFSKSNVF